MGCCAIASVTIDELVCLDIEGLWAELLTDTGIGILLEEDSPEDSLFEVGSLGRNASIQLHWYHRISLLTGTLLGRFCSHRVSSAIGLVELEDSEEGFLGYFNCTDLLHALLTFLLLFEELTLT